MIRNIRSEDAWSIADIYNYYIVNSTATFETKPLEVSDMSERIAEISVSYPFLAYETDGVIIGYCYAHRWKKRAAYDGVVELSVYLAHEYLGRGIGTALMRAMIRECKRRGYRALITCVTEGNDTSMSLQMKFGFSKVAHFRDVGFKFGRLLDIVYYELVLNNGLD